MNAKLAQSMATESGRHARPRRIATSCAAVAAGAAVALLGVSGWFLAAAAAAGVAGIAAAQAFNYLLPSAAIRLLAIARTGARYGERLFGHDVALKTLARVRPALFAAIARDAPARALAVAGGEAATALAQDVGTMEGWLVRRLSIAGPVAAAVVGAAATASAGWAPALAAICCVALAVGGALVLRRRLRASSLAVRSATAALKDELALLAAARVELRCHGLEGWAAARLDRQGMALSGAQRHRAALQARLEAWQAACVGLAAASALGCARQAGAPMAALAGLAAAMAVDGVSPLVRHLAQRAEVDEAVRRLDAHLDRAGPPVTPARHDAPAASPSLTWRGPVEAHVAAGTRVAVVGPSGCGKTRFVETLIGLRAAVPQRFFIDGQDIAELTAGHLRATFAWLPQDATLLAGTVRENLALAGDGIDELSMWRALRDAALDKPVHGLPQGLGTWIGQDGARLSGGERRRLALARALLVKAPWLLLDEPTEGLDGGTERLVLARLASRLASTGQGLLVVTHRPAVMALCGHTIAFGTVAAGAPPRQGPASRRSALS